MIAEREKDFELANYSYELPQDQIAQHPPAQRGKSRLMALTRKDTSAPLDTAFDRILDLLPKGSLLVANNSRVIHARLTGLRPNGGQAEFLLLTPPQMMLAAPAPVEGLLRPAAKIHLGDRLRFGKIELEIVQKGDFGKCRGMMTWPGDLADSLDRYGALPLPPYIKRKPDSADEQRYQTVYASNAGSLAAPTAGLHFTPEMIESLTYAGHEWLEISLHVGYGTFSPVRANDIRKHEMHAEFVEISPRAAGQINTAKAEGRPIIAVGTTSCRALEASADANGIIAPRSGMVDIFIYPGHKFRIIDGLLTNFHLPCSSLLMLVSAFAGRERVLAAYRHAVDQGYRFFSYGDAMLIT